MRRHGPKPKYGETAGDFVKVRVTAQQHSRLREAAKANLSTVADLLRDAVESYVADFSDDPMFEDRATP